MWYDSLMFFIFILFFSLGLNPPAEVGEREHIELLLNCENAFALPRNYRTTEVDSQTFKGTTKGLSDLRASASGQFSELGLKLLLDKKCPVIIVDLREESHGFLNGHAICWRTESNCANRGKSLTEIEQDEYERRIELMNVPCLILDDILIHPNIALDEKTLIQSTGNSYIRIPVTDHRIPSDDAVEQFIAFHKGLSSDTWVHYHCSAGKGRSSLFMVMHDILRNGHELSLKDILHRQGELGGKNFTLPIIAQSWKAPYEEERLAFIDKFYLYHQETQGSIPWSVWTKNK